MVDDNRKYCTPLSIIPVRDYRNNIRVATTKSDIKNKIILMPNKNINSDNNSSFSSGRKIYLKVNYYNVDNITSLQKQYEQQNNNLYNRSAKFINVQSSDQYIQRRKNLAIGNSSSSIRNSNGSYEFSFFEKNINCNTIKQALNRNRNNGNTVSNLYRYNMEERSKKCNKM
tara:strand:- start:107 stop:619 length:513 start_codon:yes stop_codon:yes gene_type:complete